MLFLGAALFKLGFFEERRAGWHKRAALLGLTLGLGMEALTTWAAWSDLSGVLSGLTASLHELSSLGLALGYMGGIALLVHSNTLSWLTRGVSASSGNDWIRSTAVFTSASMRSGSVPKSGSTRMLPMPS